MQTDAVLQLNLLFLCIRDSAAVDEHRARTCFQALLVFLEEQWYRSVQENNILQGPDFSRMKDYLLVEQIWCSVQKKNFIIWKCTSSNDLRGSFCSLGAFRGWAAEIGPNSVWMPEGGKANSGFGLSASGQLNAVLMKSLVSFLSHIYTDRSVPRSLQLTKSRYEKILVES